MEYFPGFITLQLSHKVHEFMTKVGDPSQFKGRIIFMSMFNDIVLEKRRNEDSSYGDLKTMNGNALLTSHL